MAWRTTAAWVAALLLTACGSGGPEAGAGDEGGAAAGPSGSGLQMTELQAGDGPSPAATDTVVVHYHGTFEDGSVFDSSVERGQKATFPLNRVIPCWTQALQRMKVGGKSRIVCPPELAYGPRGAPPRIPPNATLIFEVELFEIR